MSREALNAVIALLQWTRGMCSDEVDHTEIDVKLAEAIEMLRDVRDGVAKP